jgi:hypothetical protein
MDRAVLRVVAGPLRIVGLRCRLCGQEGGPTVSLILHEREPHRCKLHNKELACLCSARASPVHSLGCVWATRINHMTYSIAC